MRKLIESFVVLVTTGCLFAAPGATGCCAAPAEGAGEPSSSRRSVPAARVTFFHVPLECQSVPGVGCGPVAKEVLKELDHCTWIAEAWLNYGGTILAAIWKRAEDRPSGIAAVESLFKERDSEATPLDGHAFDEALKDFSSDGKWYRSTDVDRLTELEAHVIANKCAARIVQRLTKRLNLPSDRGDALRADLAVVLERQCLEKFLSPTWRTGWRTGILRDKQQVLDAARKHLDPQELAALDSALEEGLERLPTDDI